MGTEVVRLDTLRGPLLAGLVWSAFALVSLALGGAGDAVLLMWLPSAVAVASLYATPRARWPHVLVSLAVFQVATMGLLGLPLKTAAGFSFAYLTEAVICTRLGMMVLGGRSRSPETFAEVSLLFVTAMAGCLAGAIVAMPFRTEQDLAGLAGWFLSTSLAVLSATPILLYLRHWLGFGDQDVRFWRKERYRWFLHAVAAMFALGLVVFTSSLDALLPLLFVAIVFAVIRYGQVAAACGVIVYGLAGMLVSFGGDTPAASLGSDPVGAGLNLQALMLLMLATALPIASMMMTRERLAAQLRAQNDELHDNLTILRLAESLAGIGRWRYDVRSGDQAWSPLMLELNGLPRDLSPDPGNIRALLPDGGEQLFGELAAHREDREPYNFEYRIRSRDSAERILRMHVTNEFDERGERVALFAVAMDVTEQSMREEALHRARQRAIGFAAEAQKLANTDTLTGLANRRCTLDWFDRLVRATAEVGEPLTVLMFDIDHFKRVNDNHGHQAGDEVLRRVAAIARAELRTEDVVGRIGGEEFVSILPGLTIAEAGPLAERLCSAIAEESGGDGLPQATISVGLAGWRQGDSADSLLGRADAALYEAKQAGRNRVRLAA